MRRLIALSIVLTLCGCAVRYDPIPPTFNHELIYDGTEC